jgi:uncharacterized protein (TIGR03067 family)
MRLPWLRVLLGGLLLGSAAGQGSSAKQEQERFQGTWRLVKFDLAEGRSLPGEVLAKSRFTFQGDRLTVTEDGKLVDEATFTLDPTRTPKTIDVTAGRGPNKGKVSQGIYAFEGDTLKLCSAAPGQKRPTEFKTDRASRTALLVLRRAKS